MQDVSRFSKKKYLIPVYAVEKRQNILLSGEDSIKGGILMKNFKSSARGVTLMTLVVYIISLIFAIAILTIVTSYFRANLDKMKKNTLDIAEHDKFNSYFLEETKRMNNEAYEPREDGKVIEFTSGNRYQYVPSEFAVYRVSVNENIKIAERVTNCKFIMSKQDEKVIITVKMNVGNENRTVEYVMEKGNMFGDYEGNYTSKKWEKGEPPPSGGTDFLREAGVVEIVWIDLDNNVISAPLSPATHLGINMKPVKWTGTPGSYMETTLMAPDASWYSYEAQTGDTDGKTSRWANAIKDGESYFVWIPRYAYKITYFKKTTDPNKTAEENANAYRADNKSTVGMTGYSTVYGLINKAENKIVSGTETGITQRVQAEEYADYIPHPAFLGIGTENLGGGFGTNSKGIEGFWVAKYEISQEKSGVNIDTTNTVDGNVAISSTIKAVSKPGKNAWRSINIANAYENSRVYDSANGSHLIKNSEWGAVAYLAHSKYGRNGKAISTNNSDLYTTGNSGGVPNAGSSGIPTYSQTYAYNTAQGVTASTTGNIYGIYDMAGGSYEFVAAYNKVYSGTCYTGSTYRSAGNTHFASFGGTSTKYATTYSNGMATTSGDFWVGEVSHTGDAIHEVWVPSSNNANRGWFKNYCGFLNIDQPHFDRGRSLWKL